MTIRLVGQFEEDGKESYTGYAATALGRVVAQMVKSNLKKLKADTKPDTEPVERPPR